MSAASAWAPQQNVSLYVLQAKAQLRTLASIWQTHGQTILPPMAYPFQDFEIGFDIPCMRQKPQPSCTFLSRLQQL